MSLSQKKTPPEPGASLPAVPLRALLLVPCLPLVVMLAWLALHASASERTWVMCIPLLSLALSAGLAFHYHRLWRRPLRQFATTLEEIRAGKAAIERLGLVRGGMSPLVPHVQQLLRDLRLQKQRIAELEEEMSLKVAQRTLALQRMVGSLKLQATLDPLTGLCNRRWLDRQLKTLIEQCVADGVDVCALMIDVDHFKRLNDTLGHGQGDELLRSLGRLIRCTIREDDAAFRFGGDEFLVLMPGSGLEAGQALARRLETLVQSLTMPLPVSPKPRLSIGLACLSDLPKPAPEKLLELADRNLYAVKKQKSGTARRLTKTGA